MQQERINKGNDIFIPVISATTKLTNKSTILLSFVNLNPIRENCTTFHEERTICQIHDLRP